MKFEKIRVKVEKKYHPIYKELTKKRNQHSSYFESHSKIFLLCALLAYREKEFKELDSSEALFWADSFDDYEVNVALSIVLNELEYDYGIIDDDEAVIRKVEQYANRGIEILIEQVLDDYLKFRNGEYVLKIEEDVEFEKDILHLIDENYKGDYF